MRALSRGPCSWLIAACVAGALVAGCGGGLRRFAHRPVLWEDPDRAPFAPKPAKRSIPLWAAVDHLVFRRVASAFRLETSREAVNVNALDEVPDSSWFENRLGAVELPPDVVARGACEDVERVPPFPWRVVAGKSEGAHPGFTIEAADGVRYLLKTDGPEQPEHNTAADAIGAAIFHAAGYHVPCNTVAYVPLDVFALDPSARIERPTGSERLPREEVERVLEAAARASDGLVRVGLSRFVEGEPLGPWTFSGTRPDDPNDIVPHERRREVRAMFLLAAWLGHFDVREPNTLASWIRTPTGDAGHVRHYVIDFDDSFGILVPHPLITPRLGHQHWIDFGDALEDLLTLGLLDRPWHRARINERAGIVLGYFDDASFDADRWRPGYPTPAFEQRTEHDLAWMARIVARYGDAHVRALVGRGAFSDRRVEAELERILRGRRRRILERYLTRLSPLTSPGGWAGPGGTPHLCLDDLAVTSGLRAASGRRYEARAYVGERLDSTTIGAPQARHGRVCVPLPRVEAASLESPRYLVVDVGAETPGVDRPGLARLHLYVTDRYEVVGLERITGRGRPG